MLDILQEPIEQFERTRLILQVGSAWSSCAKFLQSHCCVVIISIISIYYKSTYTT